jgi:hypothetical protein
VVIMAASDGGIFPEKKSGFSCPLGFYLFS